EDALGGALQVLVADAVDERRDVDVAWAGVDAGGVVAVQAARAFDGGLAGGEGWGQVAEALGQLVGAGPGARQVVQGIDHGSSLSFLYLAWNGGALRPNRRQASSHRYCTDLENSAVEVGAGLPAMGCAAAPMALTRYRHRALVLGPAPQHLVHRRIRRPFHI